MKHALVFLSLALLGIELCYGTPARRDFVTRRGEPIYIECDTAQAEPVVKTALEMLARDCAAVLDAELHISPTLDSIAKQGSFIVMTSQALEGWERFSLQSRAGKLFLGASDAHGMAYGLLEISRLLGVSPWEWWADVTPTGFNFIIFFVYGGQLRLLFLKKSDVQEIISLSGSISVKGDENVS